MKKARYKLAACFLAAALSIGTYIVPSSYSDVAISVNAEEASEVVSGFSYTSTTSQINLCWNPVSSAKTYRIYKKNSDGKYIRYKDIKLFKTSKGRIKCIISGLLSDTKYTFAVSIVKEVNGEKVEGKKKGVKVSTKAPKPAVAPAGNDNEGYGTITGNITYKYNDFKGHVGDTDAKVYLIPKNISNGNIDFFNLKENIGVYKTTVDGTGTYTFNHVPAREYAIVVISSETTDSSAFYMGDDKWSDYVKDSVNDLIDNTVEFTNLWTVFHKFQVDSVAIYKGETTTYSYDFGITFI